MKLQCPLILVILLGYSFVLTAQNSATYTSTPFIIEKAAVQNMSSVKEGFDLDIRYLGVWYHGSSVLGASERNDFT